MPSGHISIAAGEPPETMTNIIGANHGNALQSSTGMPDAAAAAVRAHLYDIMAERFGSQQGCRTNYIAVAVRRRPR